MRFTKMQGLGNDYLYINCFEETIPESMAPLLAKRLSNRHFGVGSDGIVLIMPDGHADFRMRMFNADGSEAEMCGNASRCIGKYVYEKGLTAKSEISLATGSGIRKMKLNLADGHVESVRVEMGIPELKPEKIPVHLPGEQIVGYPVTAGGIPLSMTCVSMGNPHAVFFVDDSERFDVHGIGRILENDPMFPRRTNVEFATVTAPGKIRMRVWERGSGETMACGTGACATLVAAVLNGLTGRDCILALNGGELRIIWDEESGSVFQEGPAEFVFEGTVPFAD